jgi:hypothetical protein
MLRSGKVFRLTTAELSTPRASCSRLVCRHGTAQGERGVITGTVADAQGGVLPGVASRFATSIPASPRRT